MQAARDNVKDPPGIFVKFGLESLRGTQRFIEEDLPRAFGDVDDLHLLGDLADASCEASAAVGAYVTYLEDDLAPRARGSFRLGADRFGQKLQLEEGLTLDADRLLAIAMRELHATQEEFRRAASRLDGKDPVRRVGAGERGSSGGRPGRLHRAGAARRARDVHPAAGSRQRCRSPRRCRSRRRRVSIAGRSPACGPRGHSRREPLRGFYYITDVDPSWPPDRQEEHLRDFSYGALWAISIHEVFPGHFLHYQHLRRLTSTLRKSILFSSAAMVEGWAHYVEQMMVEAGFRRQDPVVKLGQLAESLIRLCRLIVGVRLHCEDLSVEQGVRFFRDEAYLEESAARREAERGTFDPSYVLYSLGKLMVLKLRDDYTAQGRQPVLAPRVPRHPARERNGAALAAPEPDARREQWGYA